MEIKEFRTNLTAALTTKLGFGYEIFEQDVNKINRTEHLGISILRTGSCISPVVYVENFFQQYQNGSSSMDEIVDEVIGILQANEVEQFDSKALELVHDWSSAKSMIHAKLINTANNQEYLESVPSVSFLNLSVVFFVTFNEFLGSSSGSASVTVTNDLLKVYGVTTDDLMEQAMKNMESEGVNVRPLTSILFELLSEVDTDIEGIDIPDIDENDETGMFVMTNGSRVFGAAAIACDKVRRTLAEQFHGQDCYILPYSIHELLVLPCREGMDPVDLLAMVDYVNSTEVAEEDFLATNIYLFHGNTCEVEIAA